MSFTRKIEDFVCEHCGAKITGNGYTNHCSHCLWSKHVDIEPGDRAETCGGMMRPISVSQKNGEYIISFRCEKCGTEKNNKAFKDDDFSEILKIVELPQ